jgi:dimethylargininase
MRIAITREVSPNINRCLLTHLAREPIDVATARDQHRRYQECLESLGCQVHVLPAEENLPDSVFIEDTAVVLNEVAIITRPGAERRRLETRSVVQALRSYRQLVFIETPGTLDGGDVLCVGRRVFVGLSDRSNQVAVEQVCAALSPFGYTVQGVSVSGCLHLKSAVTQVAKNTLLVNRAWVDGSAFASLDLVDVHPVEPSAGNALMVGDSVIFPGGFPKTSRRLQARGLSLEVVDLSELAKAEGAVTCCSLVFSS